MKTMFYIAVGGGLGALIRFVVTKYMQIYVPSLPLGTLFVNATGSLIMGFCFFIFDEKMPNNTMQFFVLIGFLGAYTTFSTYALETVQLVKNNDVSMAVLNVLFNNALSLAMLVIGMFAAKLILRVIQ